MASPAAILQIYVDAQTGQAETRLNRMNTALKRSEVQANRSTGAVSKHSGALKTLGLVGAAAAAYGLYKAVSVGAKFEKQMDSLGAVSGATAKEMKKLEAQALK